MLPNGLLSLHGYTVSHGYFSGTCVGSKELPFEQSCELVKLFITSAQSSLDNTLAFQAALRGPATEGKAWMRLSVAHPKGRYYGRQNGKWALVDVRMETTPWSDGTGFSSRFYYSGDTAWKLQADKTYKVEEVESEIQYQYGKTLLEVCQDRNVAYAKWLEHEVDSLRRYIAWQTERVNTWKPAELVEIKGRTVKDDKQGFKVTEPAY